MSNTKNAKTKNLTIALTAEEQDNLDFLVDYFQDESISTVTKSDVIKFMLLQFKKTAENDLMNDLKRMIKEKESITNE